MKILIIGGGIVGLATAYTLNLRWPDAQITVLEKEPSLGFHQSGRNSGVLHSGIYYKPGSLRATNCREGKQLMQTFCEQEGIPFTICGKVIVAVEERERPFLHNIYQRGQANGVNCTLISAAQLREIEPHAAGVEAIHVPEAGITDYRQVCARLGERLVERGQRVVLETAVSAIYETPHEIIANSDRGAFTADLLINCTGLHSDRLTRRGGATPPAQIVPFRGEYYELLPTAHHLCRGLIYPVPDPSFPFLGVHFTRMVSGGVECGPNAVLALAREGYGWGQINLRDLGETLRYAGFQRLAAKYWRTGLGEMWRSVSKRAFVKALQRLVPEIRAEQLRPAPAGVRAQALLPDGSMMDDFAFVETRRIINVVNAPSPAATSSLQIGQTIADKVAARA